MELYTGVPALPKLLWHAHFLMPDISESAGQSRIMRHATLAGACILVTGHSRAANFAGYGLAWLLNKRGQARVPALPKNCCGMVIL